MRAFPLHKIVQTPKIAITAKSEVRHRLAHFAFVLFPNPKEE